MNEALSLKIVFNQGLPYNQMSVLEADLPGDMRGLVVHGSWQITIDPKVYAKDMATRKLIPYLAHEATHVWQGIGHKNSASALSKLANPGYKYYMSNILSKGFNKFSTAGSEQQATMVMDIYRLSLGMDDYVSETDGKSNGSTYSVINPNPPLPPGGDLSVISSEPYMMLIEHVLSAMNE